MTPQDAKRAIPFVKACEPATPDAEGRARLHRICSGLLRRIPTITAADIAETIKNHWTKARAVFSDEQILAAALRAIAQAKGA